MDPKPVIAARISHFREAMSYKGHGKRTAFAKRIGLSPQAYYAVEKGRAISQQTIAKIVAAFPGGGLEPYFLRGVTDYLTLDMARRLGVVPPEEPGE